MLSAALEIVILTTVAVTVVGWPRARALWQREAAAEGTSRRYRGLDILRLGFDGIDRGIAALEGTFLTIAFLAMVLLYFHHMLDGSHVWEGKVPIYLMLWVGFLGASLATRQKKHLAVEAVFKASPMRVKAILRVLSGLVAAAVSFALAFLGWGFTVQTYNLRNVEKLVPLPLEVVRGLDSIPESLAPFVEPISGWTDTALSTVNENKVRRKLVTFPTYNLEEDPLKADEAWDPWYEDARDHGAYAWFSEGWPAEGGKPPWLGLTLDSVRVAGVVDGSPADRAGLVVGDVILKVDRKSVEDAAEIEELWRKKNPGEQVRFVLAASERGEERTVAARIGPSIALAGIPKWFVESIMPLTLLLIALRFLIGDAGGTAVSILQIGAQATGEKLAALAGHDAPSAEEVAAAAAKISGETAPEPAERTAAELAAVDTEAPDTEALEGDHSGDTSDEREESSDELEESKDELEESRDELEESRDEPGESSDELEPSEEPGGEERG